MKGLAVPQVQAALVFNWASENYSVGHARACASARGDVWLCFRVAQHVPVANQTLVSSLLGAGTYI